VEGINYKILIELRHPTGDCIGAVWIEVWDHFGERDVSERGDEVKYENVSSPESSLSGSRKSAGEKS
jgi:hypothetical protein